jgi:hypothetical protein
VTHKAVLYSRVALTQLGYKSIVFKFTTLLALFISLSLFGFSARAVPDYFGVLVPQFHLEASPQVKEARCTYCHINKSGAAPWNPFGERIRMMLFMAENEYDIMKTLYATLLEDEDSDGDGYTDTLEVVAGTLPGDPKSTPTASVDGLKTQLEKLGGVAYFKPR